VKLVACGTCRRHVQPEAACPFCLARGRGRLIAASLLALGLTGCPEDDVAIDATPVYGDAPVEASTDAGIAAQTPEIKEEK
jgi:hypothetical protein